MADPCPHPHTPRPDGYVESSLIRVVACKGWRWMPGMRVTLSSGLVVRLGEHDEGSLWWAMLVGGATCAVDVRHPAYTVAPDLTDPATLGCLLALVREAWSDECACVLPVDYGPGGVMWVCQLTAGGRSLTARHWRTEAEALVAALEAK